MYQIFARGAAVAGLLLLGVATPAQTAETGDQTQPRQPTAATGGSSWSTEVQPSGTETGATSEAVDPQAIEQIRQINAYFNRMVHLEGRFTQIDPNNDRTKGRFYVQRPGKLRFDYAPPSKMRIVSDGEYLTIEDHDLNTVDKFPLDATPFKLLLTPEVDLIRDARILGFKVLDGMISVTLEDRSGDSTGQIKLFFAAPSLELKEWIITDPQGLDTRIQVADLVAGKELGTKFFATTTVDFPSFSESAN